MATKRRPSFDPKSFLAKVGEGRSIGAYHKDQIVIAQGDLRMRSSTSREAG
jgi:CRP/FNR family cyclic AMP-dependent transcriptional regulator